MTSPQYRLAGLWAPPPLWGWWAAVPENGFSFSFSLSLSLSLSRGRGPASAGDPVGPRPSGPGTFEG